MHKNTTFSRGKIRLILYTITVITVLGIFGIVQTVKLSKAQREVLVTNQMALVSLDENLNNIGTNLEKVMYSSTPTMLSKLAFNSDSSKCFSKQSSCNCVEYKIFVSNGSNLKYEEL